MLAASDLVLLGALRGTGRLPALGLPAAAALAATLLLTSGAALALGLLASAAVRDTAQATLALPMLCFPQVLFAGGVVPIDDMTAGGRAVSTLLVNRWAFGALATLARRIGRPGRALGRPRCARAGVHRRCGAAGRRPVASAVGSVR